MTSKKTDNRITKKDLRKMFWRSLPMEFSWHYERELRQEGYENILAYGICFYDWSIIKENI